MINNLLLPWIFLYPFYKFSLKNSKCFHNSQWSVKNAKHEMKQRRKITSFFIMYAWFHEVSVRSACFITAVPISWKKNHVLIFSRTISFSFFSEQTTTEWLKGGSRKGTEKMYGNFWIGHKNCMLLPRWQKKSSSDKLKL